MVTTYDEALKKFKKTFSQFLNAIDVKLKQVTVNSTTFSGPVLTLQNNTVHTYKGSGIRNLTINYPEGDFIASIILNTATNGEINITWPSDTIFVGSQRPEFYPAESWEINIHNKRVACAQLYRE